MSRGAGAVALLLAVGTCTPLPPKPPARTFVPDAEGLAVSGTSLRVDFGRAPAGVIEPLTRDLGPADPLSLAGCPRTITQRLRWETLELTFTAEQFVGWRQGGDASGQVCG